MPRQERKRAEKIIVSAIEKLYPDLKVRPTTGNYILNQLLKAGFTNDKIQCTPEEVREDLAQAAFACKTDDFANLVPQPLILSEKDMNQLAQVLINPPAATKKLQELMKKGRVAVLSAGPRPEQNVIITNIRPDVHFYGFGGMVSSPCGNEDPEAPVTNNDFEVTCQKCKEWLAKPVNPKGK